MSIAALAATFNRLEMPWIVSFLGNLGSQQFEPSTFCAADPPADPGMTALDWANVLNVGATVLNVEALRKLSQLVARYLWFVMCQCDSGAQPTPPSPLTPPSGVPLVNPPAIAPTYPSGQPCLVTSYSIDTIPDGVNHFLGRVTLPPGATLLVLDNYFTDAPTTPTPNFQASNFVYNAAGSTFGGVTTGYTGAIHNVHSAQMTLLSTYTQFEVWHNTASGQPSRHMEVRASVYCGTTPGGGGPYPTPCPEDPITLALLDQVLTLVRLIQRQAVPFAYITSTVHSGLTGQGEIAVQGLIGVRVLVTGMGPGVGVDDGNPDTLWSAGRIRWGNDDGWDRTVWIDASPITSIPTSAGQYTRIGYTLSPGVEVTITELVREA